MANWFKKAQNWFKRNKPKTRFSFSIEGDIFVDDQNNPEIERYQAEEQLIGFIPASGEGIKINDYKIEPYQKTL